MFVSCFLEQKFDEYHIWKEQDGKSRICFDFAKYINKRNLRQPTQLVLLLWWHVPPFPLPFMCCWCWKGASGSFIPMQAPWSYNLIILQKIYTYANAQIQKCTNTRMYKYTNAQTYKCTKSYAETLIISSEHPTKKPYINTHIHKCTKSYAYADTLI